MTPTNSSYITVSLPNTVSLKKAIRENKTITIITAVGFIALGISIGMPLGALIYNEITSASLASCPYS